MALVVKVKYEGTLRRFNVYQRQDGNLDISLDALRSKICELFNFNPNTQLVITYTDEDDDAVTMADEEDLLDALGQGLNPLRLGVSLIAQNKKVVETRSQSESSTPRMSLTPKAQGEAFDPRSICLEEAVKVAAEPLQTPKEQGRTSNLASLCLDETLKLVPEPFRNVFMKCTQDPFMKDVGSSPAVLEFMEGLIRIATAHFGPLTEGVQALGTSSGAQVNNSTLPTIGEQLNQCNQNFQSAPQDLLGPSAPPVSGEAHGNHNCKPAPQHFSGSLAPSVSGEAYGKGLKRNWGLGENMLRTFHKGVQCDGCGIRPIVGPRYKSVIKENYDLCYSCFSEMGNENDYMRIDRALYRPPRFSREALYHGGRPFHKPPHSFPFSRSGFTPYSQAASCAGKLANQPLGKLDCRFVQDVTVFDGTQLAPGTPFTKIWRLRNNGTLRWPALTRLVRIGGDELGAENEVNLEIQEEGYPVDAELDAAIDFIAPMQPGRYTSYWRLMAPSGQKFGQRVWVLIQVETPREDALPQLMESLLSLEEMNPTDAFQGQSERNMVDEAISGPDDKMSLDIPDAVHSELGNFSIVEQTSGKSPFLPVQVADVPAQVQESDVTKEPGASTSTPVMPYALGGSSSASVKTVPAQKASEGHIAVSASAPSLPGSGTYSPVHKEVLDANGAVEQSLLRELEDMGFSQRTLNAELLRKNNYDLQTTVDELCGATEWDPILAELQEMGFVDTETNKRLLSKNAGSVKRVVLDLLSAGKNAPSMQSSPSKKDD